jgi:hypothetical protein
MGDMAEDAELDLFHQTMNCTAVLDQIVGARKLDARESASEAPFARRPVSIGPWGLTTESR